MTSKENAAEREKKAEAENRRGRKDLNPGSQLS